jgi:hypothetical protein
MGSAWERHDMCELDFRFPEVKTCEPTLELGGYILMHVKYGIP